MERSFHFIPADKKEWIDTSSSLGADITIFDLEDSVPEKNKVLARRNLLLISDQFDSNKHFIRINSADSSFFHDDIELILNINMGNIVIPKTTTLSDLDYFFKHTQKLKHSSLIILVENLNIFKELDLILSTYQENIYALGLGLEDMLATVPFFPEEIDELINFIQCQISFLSMQYKIYSIDGVSLEYKNMNTFSAICKESKRRGFTGKFSIHPNQIKPININFSPPRKNLEWAQGIIRDTESFCDNNIDNQGYMKTGTTILSPPKIKKANAILEFFTKYHSCPK